jgi:hypothetical protein
MAKAKRVRWECPEGLHPGVLGSTRPPKDSTVRFCWPCSEAAGRLVQRRAPALERKRSQAAERRAAKSADAKAREAEVRARALVVEVLDAEGLPFELDAGVLLREAWRSQAMREVLALTWQQPGRQAVPEFTIRRGTEQAARARRDCRSERARDRTSGHAYSYGGPITMTVGPGCGEEWVRAIVIHEAVHAALPEKHHHGSWWRSGYLRVVRELYDIEPILLAGQAAWKLDEQIAAAILTVRSEC